MPLNDAIAARSHELSSRISYEPWSSQLKQRITRVFGIPPDVNTDGIVFQNKNTVFGELRDHFLVLQLRGEHSIHPYDHRTAPYPIELKLPRVFAEGTLTLTDSDDYPGQKAQSLLQFTDPSNPIIRFNPHSPYHYNLYSTISYSTILASVPRENLMRVNEGSRQLIVMQPVTEDEYMGFDNSHVMQLTRDHHGIIQATDIVPDRRESDDYWTDHARTCRELAAVSTGVFFILDKS